MLPRGFLSPPRHGFTNRAHHPTRRRRALRSHPESLDSNHRLSPRSLHKTMSGHGGKGQSGRPGQHNPEFASSASSGGDESAPHPPGAMKRGLSATSKPVRPSVPAGMDGGHSQSPIDQWIIWALTGDQPPADSHASVTASAYHPPRGLLSIAASANRSPNLQGGCDTRCNFYHQA